MAVGEVIGSLAVVIGADISGLQKGVGDVKKELGGLQGGLTSIAGTLAKVAGAAVAAGVALTAGLVHSGLEAIDAQSKLARQLGGTIAGVQTLIHTADLAGISQESLTQSVNRLNSKLGEAIRDGMSPAADALRRLGLNAAELSKMDIDARMAAVADAVKRLGLNSAQTSDLMQQMGVRGGKLTVLMMEGGQAFRDARNNIVAYGVALTNIDGRMVEQANDAWKELGLIFIGIKNQLALFAAPILLDIAKRFKEGSDHGRAFGAAVQSAIAACVAAVGFLADRLRELAIMWNVVALGIAGVKVLAKDIEGMWSDAAKVDAEEAKKQYDAIMERLKSLWTARPPSEWLADYLKTVQDAGEKAAKLLAAGFKPNNDPAGGEQLTSKEIKQYQEKLERLKQSVASEDLLIDLHQKDQLAKLAEYGKKLGLTDIETNILRDQIKQKHDLDMSKYITETLEAGLLTELEILERRNAMQLEAIDRFEKNRTGMEERAAQMRRALAQKEALDKAQIYAASGSRLASIIDTSMSAITSIMSEESQKGFTVMKAISMATAMVHGFMAALAAYRAGVEFGALVGNPMIGQAMGIAFAGIAAAGTAAMIAKIAGVGPSSGGAVDAGPISSGGGGGGGAVAAAGDAGGGPSHVANISISGVGDRFTGKQIRELIEQINEASGDGVLIKVSA